MVAVFSQRNWSVINYGKPSSNIYQENNITNQLATPYKLYILNDLNRAAMQNQRTRIFRPCIHFVYICGLLVNYILKCRETSAK